MDCASWSPIPRQTNKKHFIFICIDSLISFCFTLFRFHCFQQKQRLNYSLQEWIQCGKQDLSFFCISWHRQRMVGHEHLKNIRKLAPASEDISSFAEVLFCCFQVIQIYRSLEVSGAWKKHLLWHYTVYLIFPSRDIERWKICYQKSFSIQRHNLVKMAWWWRGPKLYLPVLIRIIEEYAAHGDVIGNRYSIQVRQ